MHGSITLNIRYFILSMNAITNDFSYHFVMKRFLYTALFLLVCFTAQSQTPIEHRILNKDIRSVSIYPIDQPLSMPIVPMNGVLEISFDDLGEYIRELEYTIIHCKRDWTPSNLNISEYLDGFDDASLRDFNSSRGSILDYMHYDLRLPNDDIKWRISGNYILKVWDRDNDNELLMTLRFVVYETNVQFTQGEVFESGRLGSFDTHESLTYALRIKDIGLDAPMRSISSSVFQNQNWHSMIDSINPRRVHSGELYFDQRNSVIFPAMRQYRLTDLRSLSSPGYGVASVEEYTDGINVTKTTDEVRGFEVGFGRDDDLNGAFVIDNTERLNDLWGVQYAYTLFTLHYFNAPPDADIYLLGAFNQYQVDEHSKMELNEPESIFYKEVLLKQGVYDYVYGVKRPNEPISFQETEGYDNRAQNDYHVIIYYHPFLGTYDRVIAYATMSAR